MTKRQESMVSSAPARKGGQSAASGRAGGGASRVGKGAVKAESSKATTTKAAVNTAKRRPAPAKTARPVASVTPRQRPSWLAWRLAPALRRDIAAVALVVLATLTAWGLLGEHAGLLGLWIELLRRGFGWAALLVPVALIALVVELFRTPSAEAGLPVFGPRVRHILGSTILFLAFLGLLHLPAPDFANPRPDPGLTWWEAGQGGGFLGYLIAIPLVTALRPIGAAIVLLGLAIVAAVIVFNIDLRSLGHVLTRSGRTVAASLSPSGLRSASGAPPPLDDDDDDPTPERIELPRVQATKAALVEVPPLEEAVPVEPELPPIINMPTPAGRRGTTPTVETIERPVKPRPALDQPVEPLVVGSGQLPLPAEPLPIHAQAPELHYPMPLVSDLPIYDSVMPNQEELGRKARRIEETLAAFRVEAKVREINPGAAVTQFALEPGAGVKVRSIKILENDLALALAASTIAIETPIPGQSRVGIVIPNKHIAIVGLRETMESPEFLASKAKLPLALGRDVNGRYIIADLAKMPHLLIAGSTGSGKSVCINSIISTFLLSRSPDQVKMVMVDPKMVELVGYNGVPHLKSPVVIEMDKVVGTLRKALSEMERRYQLFSQLSVRNIDGYNAKREIDPQMENLPYLVVIIDELADLMMTVPDEVESVIVRLAQMARATGIHLIIATQRPSVDVLTGLIKANFPARIAFMVTSQIDSRVILDGPGADRLLGKGDMLFQDPQAAKPVRVQGTFVHDRDIEKMVSHWRQVVPLPQYEPDWTNVPAYRPGDDDEDQEDPMMAKALKIVEEHGTISTSMLQRKLKIGYNKAARLVEQMEDEGIIGPSEGVRGRTVLGSRAKNPGDPYDDGAPPPWDEE